MKNKEIQESLETIKEELEEIKGMIDEEPFNKGNIYHTQYAVIRACGAIETAFKQIIVDHFAESIGNDKINNFLEQSILKNSMNPRLDAMKRTLKKFDQNWNSEFVGKLGMLDRVDKKKDSLNSLVELRNQFAHGASINTSITSESSP